MQVDDRKRASLLSAVLVRSLRSAAGVLSMGTQATMISSQNVREHEALPIVLGSGDFLALRIAETTIGMRAKSGIKLALSRELADFADGPDTCDVQIEVSRTREMGLSQREPLFDSGGLWSVFNEDGGSRFVFFSPILGPVPYKSAWFDAEFQRGAVQLYRGYFQSGCPTYPLEYPLDELLIIHRLARGEGVELHAVGLVDECGRGHLFLGHSGAGKSTLARLWQQESSAPILSDDRIILRERDGRIWMHGTPWHGDAGIASPEAAPLYRAYLLEHANRTELSGISRGRATAELLARCFVPHYSAEAMDFTLRFLERVAGEAPCCTFRFLPDKRAVEMIRRAKD